MVKVGPREWRDMGPGRAVGGAQGVQRELGGRNVGSMIPDKGTGPILQPRSDGTAKLGIAPRWNGAPKR